ncbi:MAG: HNH endonuclease [Thermomicrobiales bacterium]|nr:HNH endonuclease [Thermomicrobiales bacterium]
MDRSKYPDNWGEISLQVRAEAGNRCEWCRVANYATGARDCCGMWWNSDQIEQAAPAMLERWFGCTEPKLTIIVLTVAHIDHDAANNSRTNLAALCQRCHLGHDREQHMANAAATRQRKRDEAVAASGQQRMW